MIGKLKAHSHDVPFPHAARAESCGKLKKFPISVKTHLSAAAATHIKLHVVGLNLYSLKLSPKVCTLLQKVSFIQT